MTGQADARVIRVGISVPGVRTLPVDLPTRTVRITGSADPAAVSHRGHHGGHRATTRRSTR